MEFTKTPHGSINKGHTLEAYIGDLSKKLFLKDNFKYENERITFCINPIQVQHDLSNSSLQNA